MRKKESKETHHARSDEPRHTPKKTAVLTTTNETSKQKHTQFPHPSPTMPASAALELGAAALTLTALDLAWINLAAPRLLGLDYLAVVRDIQCGAPAAARPVGLLAYAAMAVGAWRGATRFGARGVGESTPASCAAGAAEVGALIYTVIDMTNAFMFKGWGLGLALTDMVWGTTAFAVAGAAVGAVRQWKARG